jgi:predicted ATPase
MRIRELYFNNFRSFRGERRFSFVDPNTDTVRPVTVLAGSNGSGKTTLLETIEALLRFISESDKPADMLREALDSSLVTMTLEFSVEEVDWVMGKRNHATDDTNRPQVIYIAIGNYQLAPQWLDSISKDTYGLLVHTQRSRTYNHHNIFIDRLQSILQEFSRKYIEDTWQGGLLYFPYDRQLGKFRKGAIEPPTTKTSWVFRYTTPTRWQGSLEQLWVWQNYLDLEKGAQKRDSLSPFVTSVEQALGEGRLITIEEGRALVPVGYSVSGGETPRVSLDQLPSGEQQVLLLFGELARWRRKGVVITIDEVENSLHPTLQRLVMWNLRRLAREWDAQVIVATHSLEVINSVRGGAFINLDYPENHFDQPVPDEKDEGGQ